jgi:hypothetical protein
MLAVGEGVPALKWVNNGLQIPEDTTIEQIKELLSNFSFWQTAEAIALADVLSFAKERGWVEEMQLVFEECDITATEVRRAMAIADVPRGLRHEKLKSEHYFVVSSLPTTEKTLWLDRALKHGLNAFELKRSIEAGKVLTKEAIAMLSGKGSGIPNYHGIVNQWSRWASKVGGVKGIASWPRPVLQQWLEDMMPILDAVAAAREALK